jgi:hypothetical protein
MGFNSGFKGLKTPLPTKNYYIRSLPETEIRSRS